MNKLFSKLTFNPKKFYTTLVIVIFIASAALRFYNIAKPNEKVFDEVYFPVFAQNYLDGTEFFDSHPPLGKLAIAVSIAVFGNNTVGWRAFNALAGLLLLFVVFGFTFDLTKRIEAATIALFLVAIDPMALVESRIGLINIWLALFSIGGLWFFWRWWQTSRKKYNLVVAALCFGAAIAVKWIGIGALGAALGSVVLAKLLKLPMPPKFKLSDSWIILLIPAVYFASFIPDLFRGQDLIWWHKNAYGYHAHLDATHPYGSEWWTWPFMLRPIWLYYQSVGSEMVSGIIDPGNVITWITGLAVLLWAAFELLIKKWRPPTEIALRNMYLVVTYACLFLPWMVIGRVKFIYHYFVPALLLLILLGIVLENAWREYKEYRWLVGLVLVGGLAFFVFFLPLLIGTPIRNDYFQQHMWLRSWI